MLIQSLTPEMLGRTIIYPLKEGMKILAKRKPDIVFPQTAHIGNIARVLESYMKLYDQLSELGALETAGQMYEKASSAAKLLMAWPLAKNSGLDSIISKFP